MWVALLITLGLKSSLFAHPKQSLRLSIDTHFSRVIRVRLPGCYVTDRKSVRSFPTHSFGKLKLISARHKHINWRNYRYAFREFISKHFYARHILNYGTICFTLRMCAFTFTFSTASKEFCWSLVVRFLHSKARRKLLIVVNVNVKQSSGLQTTIIVVFDTRI